MTLKTKSQQLIIGCIIMVRVNYCNYFLKSNYNYIRRIQHGSDVKIPNKNSC